MEETFKRAKQGFGALARKPPLGAPDDIDQLHRRIAALEAEVADVRIQLEERTDELNAARSANRELMTRLNSSWPPG